MGFGPSLLNKKKSNKKCHPTEEQVKWDVHHAPQLLADIPFSDMIIKGYIEPNESKDKVGENHKDSDEKYEIESEAWAMFQVYDADKSGTVDFDEFYKLLGHVGFQLSEITARRYFRKCGGTPTKGLDFETFKGCMYTCDPHHPKRQSGFNPGKNLGPLDVFAFFDAEGDGQLDRLALSQALEFLHLDVSLKEQEFLFRSHENKETETIDYRGYRTIWLGVCDVRKELVMRGLLPPATSSPSKEAKKKLEQRKKRRKQEQKKQARANRKGKGKGNTPPVVKAVVPVKVPNLESSKLPIKALRQKLLRAIIEAEQEEDVLFNEAEWWKRWEIKKAELVELVAKARAQATDALIEAIDLGGQVYVFGRGNNNSEGLEPGALAFSNFNKITQLWHHRLSQTTRFMNVQVSKHVAWLWGRDIVKVTCGKSGVAYALSSKGQLYCWGGNSTTDGTSKTDEQSPRSQCLKQNTPALRERDAHRMSTEPFSQYYARAFVNSGLKGEEGTSPSLEQETKLMSKGICDIARYYSLAELAEAYREKPMHLILKHVLPKFTLNQVEHSLKLRGCPTKGKIRNELLTELAACLRLEHEVGCPEEFLNAFQEWETQIATFVVEKNDLELTKVLRKGARKWKALRKLRRDMAKANGEERHETLAKWKDIRDQMIVDRNFLEHRRLEDVPGTKNENQEITTSGITSRGPSLKPYDGSQAVQDIELGSYHGLLLHQSGRVYSWGAGSYGRLGTTKYQTHQVDQSQPTIIQDVQDIRFRSISCGHAHSAAISMDGTLYTWGSAAIGKLGIDYLSFDPDASNNTYCISPVVIAPKITFRQVSCGPGHTGAITTEGGLYMWGCHDGGRLGLGLEVVKALTRKRSPLLLPNTSPSTHAKKKTLAPLTAAKKRTKSKTKTSSTVISTPTRVGGLLSHEWISNISCGVTHSACVTAIRQDEHGNISGGNVFVCGAISALGQYCPSFVPIQTFESDDSASANKFVTQISCAAETTAFITTTGELYSWGSNVDGCAGHVLSRRFLHQPAIVTSMFTEPFNIGQRHHSSEPHKVSQSTSTKLFPASLATDGLNLHGQGEQYCSQTLREDYPYWEISFAKEELFAIESIRVYTRTDHPTEAYESKTKYRDRTFPLYMFITSSTLGFGDSCALQGQSRVQYPVQSERCVWAKFTQPKRVVEWTTPRHTFGRTVRIQLGRRDGILSLAQVEIFGRLATEGMGPKVTHVATGDRVIVATCAANHNVRNDDDDDQELERVYLRAIYSDCATFDILKQYQMFHSVIEKCRPRFVKGQPLARRCPLCVILLSKNDDEEDPLSCLEKEEQDKPEARPEGEAIYRFQNLQESSKRRRDTTSKGVRTCPMCALVLEWKSVEEQQSKDDHVRFKQDLQSLSDQVLHSHETKRNQHKGGQSTEEEEAGDDDDDLETDENVVLRWWKKKTSKRRRKMMRCCPFRGWFRRRNPISN